MGVSRLWASMTSELLLRRAEPADVDAIQRVATESWHAAYDDIVGPEAVEATLDEWYEDEAIQAGVDHEAQDFFVAARDGTVLGFAHVGPHPPRYVHRLYRLYVHPDEWRQGIGRQLLGEIEQALYDRDVDHYEAEVLADNEPAVAFYESTGFDRVEEYEGELGGVPVDQVIFRKRV
ncbi:N-acetyltransferase [Halobacteriales archaeon QS_4_69_31]|nr:MAG: N-acetyltransferase [Halobacteriales archaeon QS_4_69_31]